MDPMTIMSEEDIRQYFIQNGGIVRNTDIVTYFRTYLSNPAIRDEARLVFKTYVNKLAAVKVENGEKFLVLKRQYFPPIDGRGNPKPSPITSYPSTSSIASTQYAQSYGGPGLNYQQNQNPTPSIYGNSHQQDGHPYNYQTGSGTNNNYLRRQNSQPQLYGSQFSLNSNYLDPSGGNSAHLQTHFQSGKTNYNNSNANLQRNPPNFYPASNFSQSNPNVYPQNSNINASNNNNNVQLQHYQLQKSQTQLLSQNNNTLDYPPEYGLPTTPLGNINTVSSPPRRFASPQNSYGSNSNSSNSGSPSSRAPPPYRPPPPAGRFATSPSGGPLPSFSSPPNSHGISRRSSMTSMVGLPYHRTNSVPASGGSGQGSYYASTQNVNALPDPSSTGMFQYHRSASVTGIPAAVNNSVGSPPSDQSRYFENFPNLGSAPPPPVPPRSRRSVERSPSAANSLSSSTSSNINISNHAGVRNRLTTRMEAEKMNGIPSQPQQIPLMNGIPISASGSGQTMQTQMLGLEKESNNGMIDTEQEKENINNDDSTIEHDDRNDTNIAQNGNSEMEQKISVKERLQKFNRIASESEMSGIKVPSTRSRREIAAKHESGDFDTASLSSFGYSHVQLDPKSKDWMMKAMKCDYPVLNKMAQENSALVRKRDMNTALHWAAKHGDLECVKLLAGSYKAEVNIKSNGGYTPLHLAAQFGRQEVYDVLIKIYNADSNVRDHSGKKPMQYLVRQDASMSVDTFKKLKEKRRNTEQQRERDSSFLRIGSLNVKVKSTREAFGYLLGKSTSSSSIERMHKNWGSADNIPDVEEKDKQMMPPPPTARHGLNRPSSRRRPKRTIDSQIIKESKSDSDSDSAFGFGSDWTSPVRD